MDRSHCPGGEVIIVKADWWRPHNFTDKIEFCENLPPNCIGGQENAICAEGHFGALCEVDY